MKIVCHFKPTEKQRAALNILSDDSHKYVLYGGSARSGKTYLGCYWVTKLCMQYPGTRYLIARKQLSDLKATTMKTLFEKLFPALGIDASFYDYNAQDKELIFFNGSTILFRQLFYKPSDPLVQELGSLELTSSWIDEAGEIVFMVYDILKSRTGQWRNSEYNIPGKILLTSNPVKNWLYTSFFKPTKDGTITPERIFIPALPTDNEYLTQAELENLKNITDSITRERLLHGAWEYADEPGMLIEYENIVNLFANDAIPDGAGFITCDAARYGSDKAVIIRWSGLRAEDIYTFEKSATTEIEDKIREIAKDNNITMLSVIVDDDGVGGGVVDHLHCRGFINGSHPIASENYQNLKCQCYYKLAEMINHNRIFIKTNGETVKNTIIEELEQVKQRDVDSDGKLSVMPKERIKEILGRSPDFADSLMMRMYFEIQPRYHTLLYVPRRHNRI